MNKRNLLTLGIALAFLASCGGPSQAPSPPAMLDPGGKGEYDEASIEDGRLELPMEDGDPITFTGIFYFDYDEALVRREGHRELAHHARALAANPRYRVRLEGHADERGTREYNLALGERRANAVGAFILSQGAAANQIEVVSFGEEKPADLGHSQAAWAKNRRVQLVYQ